MSNHDQHNMKNTIAKAKSEDPLIKGQVLETATIERQPDFQSSSFAPEVKVTKKSAADAKLAYETGYHKAKKDNPALKQGDFNTGVGKKLSEQVNIHTLAANQPMVNWKGDKVYDWNE